MWKDPRRARHPVTSFQHGRCHLVALPHEHWTQQDQRDPIPWEPSSHSLAYKQSTFSSCLEQLRTEATSGLEVCIYLGFVMHMFHKTRWCSHLSTVLSLGFGLQSTSTNVRTFNWDNSWNPWLQEEHYCSSLSVPLQGSEKIPWVPLVTKELRGCYSLWTECTHSLMKYILMEENQRSSFVIYHLFRLPSISARIRKVIFSGIHRQTFPGRKVFQSLKSRKVRP